MLGISENIEIRKLKIENFKSSRLLGISKQAKRIIKILLGLLAVFILTLFLPWTQNTRARGKLNALQPNHRPQTIHSIIDGRIENWYVQEGDYVEKGDTIMQISEVQERFLDPELLLRTQNQIDAKSRAGEAYDKKVEALDLQIQALKENNKLRVQQAQNRLRQAELLVESDSISFEAAKVNFEIADARLKRMNSLFEQGLKSLTDLESRKQQFQKNQVALIGAENKLLSSKNERLSAEIELNAIHFDFQNKLAKAESEKFSALSSGFTTNAEVNKLQNEYNNFKVRAGMYYVVAPQTGYITRAIKVGVGELIKSGAPIISILPSDYELAAEVYIRPIDLPLVHKGNKVRFIFDGWPAIIFSGWPNLSNGTFGGVVYAVDNFSSANDHRYRVLIVPDSNDTPWPEPLRIGTGAEAIMLFNDVPVWYEIWRQLNGFPPDFYEDDLNEGNPSDIMYEPID